MVGVGGFSFLSTMRKHPEVRRERNIIGSGAGAFPSLAEVKTHLRVDFSDDDDYIGNIRLAAQSYIEQYCDTRWGSFNNYAYWDYAYPLVLIPTTVGDGSISDSSPPVLRLDVLNAAGNYVEADADTHEIDAFHNPIRVYWKGGYTQEARLNNFRLVYTTIQNTVPNYIKQAFLMLCGHFYENRQDVGKDRVYEVPMASRYLMDRYRQPQF